VFARTSRLSLPSRFRGEKKPGGLIEWVQGQEERGRGLHTVLIYDITSDRIRTRVADACLDYGLARIQYSAFFGDISGNHLEELLQRIRRLVGKAEARVEVFPLCEKDLRLRRTLTTLRLEPRARRGRPVGRGGGEERGAND
jgi:CRISPR-associated protein Cas2